MVSAAKTAELQLPCNTEPFTASRDVVSLPSRTSASPRQARQFKVSVAHAPIAATSTTAGSVDKLGQYHCNNRQYDINSGRWISPDQAASPVWNLFDYVGGRGTQQTDPTGLIIPPGLQDALRWMNGVDITVYDPDPRYDKKVDKNDPKKISTADAENVSDKFRHLFGKLDKARGGKCIRNLELQGHGAPDHFSAGACTVIFDREDQENELLKYNFPDIRRFGKELKSRMCKPCVIKIHACNVGLGMLGQILANESGCVVRAYTAYCYINSDFQKSCADPDTQLPVHNPDRNPDGSRSKFPDSKSGVVDFYPGGTPKQYDGKAVDESLPKDSWPYKPESPKPGK